MRTIRRLYFYAVALISLELVLWGLVGLARSILSSLDVFQAGAFQLAQALALVLVGVPVFLFHWLMAQRFATREMEERSSGIRAAFLYGILLGTLIPVIQNIIALVNRPVLVGMRLSSTRAFLGGTQVWTDNVIAILMNLLVAGYFYFVLRNDWKVIQPDENFTNLRRIYRWVWMLYGLGLTVLGFNQLVRYLLGFLVSSSPGGFERILAANGVVVSLVGAPLWAYAWLSLQKAQAEPGERQSLLRLGLLYLLSLTGAIVTLSTSGVIVNELLRLGFGLLDSFRDFIRAIQGPLALCVPFAVIWLYYGRWLDHAMAEETDTPRRSGMRRIYYYILSLLGLVVTFIGLAMLLSSLVDRIYTGSTWSNGILNPLSSALALLVVGLPLWLLAWRPLQAESLSSGDDGDHARRSLTRRIYLYLALFAGVIGGMVTAVSLINTLLQALFSGDSSGVAQHALKSVGILVLFIGLGLYHGLLLRRDGGLAALALGEKHAAFPVLILDPGDGFAPALLSVIQKAAPRLPVSSLPPDASLAEAAMPKAVVLPSDLALDPPAPLRKWLEKFNGERLVVPRPAGRWTLVSGPSRLPLNQAAHALRQLAEGGQVGPSGTAWWQIVIYTALGLVGLPILVSLVASLVSTLMR